MGCGVITALYRIYGEEPDDLLYVGISLSAIARLSQHKAEKPWAHLIRRVTVEHYETRQEAADAERKAIREEWPRFNVAHNDRTASEEYYWGRIVDAQSMPDMCHDFCVRANIDEHVIYFPWKWRDGVAHYVCQKGHHWTCHWGHHQTGVAPENRRRFA